MKGKSRPSSNGGVGDAPRPTGSRLPSHAFFSGAPASHFARRSRRISPDDVRSRTVPRALTLTLGQRKRRYSMLRSFHSGRWFGSNGRRCVVGGKPAERRQSTESARPAVVLAVEPLEGRCLLSGSDVVLHWNEVLLQSLTSNQHAPRVPLIR